MRFEGAIIAANFGIPELIILLVVFGVPASAVLLVVLLVRASNRRSAVRPPMPGIASSISQPNTAVGAIRPQWAADPFGRHQLRYFDGKVWTKHVSDNSTVSLDDPNS
jgi:hypothetical protein